MPRSSPVAGSISGVSSDVSTAMCQLRCVWVPGHQRAPGKLAPIRLLAASAADFRRRSQAADPRLQSPRPSFVDVLKDAAGVHRDAELHEGTTRSEPDQM